MPAVTVRAPRFSTILDRAVPPWTDSSKWVEPRLLRLVVAKLRERSSASIADLVGPEHFERSLRRLIDGGAGALKSRDDMLLAARFASTTEALRGASIIERPVVLRPLLARWADRMHRGFLAPILWRSVFTAYFITDDALARSELGSFLSSTLSQLPAGPTSPAWVDVVRAHGSIVGPRPAQAYAEDWTSGSTTSLEEVQRYAEIPSSSWFWAELVDEVLGRLSKLDDAKFAARLDRSIGLANLYPALEDKILAALLDRYVKSESPSMHDGLVQRILRRWGSPHVDISDRTFLWSQVSRQAANTVMQWLAEEDLADFFELIKSSSRMLTSMDERRFAYWKRYTGRMQYTRLVLGTGYETSSNRDIRRFIDKRRARIGWLRGGDPRNIAILMKIDDHWFVEFSQTGNACFPYRDDERPFDLKRREFTKAGLGNPRAVAASGLDRMLHHRNWEEDFDRVLARLNIWPNVTAARSRQSALQPARAVEPGQATSAPLVPGLSRVYASELARLHSKTADDRSKGGRYWIEVHTTPSMYLVEAMRVAGFRYSDPRGFYQ